MKVEGLNSVITMSGEVYVVDLYPSILEEMSCVVNLDIYP